MYENSDVYKTLKYLNNVSSLHFLYIFFHAEFKLLWDQMFSKILHWNITLNISLDTRLQLEQTWLLFAARADESFWRSIFLNGFLMECGIIYCLQSFMAFWKSINFNEFFKDLFSCGIAKNFRWNFRSKLQYKSN